MTADGERAGGQRGIVAPDGEPAPSRLATVAVSERTAGPPNENADAIAPSRGATVDVSERRQAEAEVRDALALLQLVVDSVPAYISFVDASQHYRMVNHRYEEWFERPRAEIIGKHLRDIHTETAYREMLPHVQKALAGEEVRYERLLEDAHGNMHWLENRYVPHLGDDGAVLGFCVLVFDVSERKRADDEIRTLTADLEERVRERTAQLEAVNKELEAFSYSVSHDLRAPLRHISGFAAMLRSSPALPEDPTIHRELKVIVDAASKMGRLIDDLLAFSRMGRRELVRGRVSLSRLVAEVRRELAPELAGRSIRWRIGPLPEVRGDPPMLRQVLQNLLGNAVKYTRRCDRAVIEVGCAPGPRETVFFVRDNGAGFDMQYARKLFGVFQRLHREEDFEGTGIGLAHVRRIISRHGGRTWAEGAPGKGATFYFSLPD